MNVQISTYYNIFDKNRPYYNNEDWDPVLENLVGLYGWVYFN